MSIKKRNTTYDRQIGKLSILSIQYYILIVLSLFDYLMLINDYFFYFTIRVATPRGAGLYRNSINK